MSPSSSSDETAVSSVSSEDGDISLPPSPSPSPEPSPEPYASSSDDAAAPPAKKPRRPRSGTGTGARPRSWPTADEVVLLEAVVAHRDQHGQLPSRDDLAAALAGRVRFSGEQAAERVSVLRNRYCGSVRRLSRGTVPVTDDDMAVYKLSKRLWEGTVTERASRRARREADRAAARHHERRGFAELEALYPCLAAEVEAIAARRRPCGAIKTAFGLIGDERAAALEARVRKQRRAELKAGMKRGELRDQVARTLLEFIE